jgi:hypothetical protein
MIESPADIARWILGRLHEESSALNILNEMFDHLESASYEPDFEFGTIAEEYLGEIEKRSGADDDAMASLRSVTATYSFIMNQIWNMESDRFLGSYITSSLWGVKDTLRYRAIDLVLQIESQSTEDRSGEDR